MRVAYENDFYSFISHVYGSFIVVAGSNIYSLDEGRREGERWKKKNRITLRKNPKNDL